MTREAGGTVGEPSKIRVLHVDDDSEFADLARTFLHRQSDRLEVTTATDASSGLDALAEEAFDCVVSDYDMPERNGIEFLESVRETHPDIPFLLYTGKGSEEIASEAISAGVTDYLQKESGTEQYAILANRIENVVAQQRSRRALTERNRRLETLIQNLPGMVYRCANEPGWPMQLVGGECEQLSGYDADTVEAETGLWGNEIIHPEDREFVWERVQMAIDERRQFELTYRIRTADGTVKFVWERGRGIYHENGEPDAIEGFITDITEQKRHEHELEHSNARLVALFENSPDMVNLHDGDGVIVDVNRRLCEKLGYEREDLIAKRVWDIDVEATKSDVQAMRRGSTPGGLQRFETTFERADGSRFPVEVHLSKLPLEDEERFVVISRDVSEREHQSRELRRLEREYETVFEHAQDALFLVDVEAEDGDPEFVYRRRNDAHEAMTDMTADDVRGQTPEDVFDADAAAEVLELYRACYESAGAKTARMEIGSGDQPSPVDVRLSPVVIDGDVTQIVGIARRAEREDGEPS